MGEDRTTALLVGAGVLLYLMDERTAQGVRDAVDQGGTVNVRLTGYWPFQSGLNSTERLMEGGAEGAAVWRGVRTVDPYTGGRPQLHTLEAYQRGDAPYVSVSGDPDVWPFGQRIELSAWPGVVFRVVDTGGHFTGLGKVYRVVGREPLDICVESSATVIPQRNATATIVAGDAFASGEVEYSNLQGQEVQW